MGLISSRTISQRGREPAIRRGLAPQYTTITGGDSTQFTIRPVTTLSIPGWCWGSTAAIGEQHGHRDRHGQRRSHERLLSAAGKHHPDPNPEFTTGQTNVYGSTSSGAWVVSVPVAADLNTNGTANSVNITGHTSRASTGGSSMPRYGTSIRRRRLNNSFQYAVAEGSGDIYSPTPRTAHRRQSPRGGLTSAVSPPAISNRRSSMPFIPTSTAGKTTIVLQQQRHQQWDALGRRPSGPFDGRRPTGRTRPVSMSPRTCRR